MARLAVAELVVNSATLPLRRDMQITTLREQPASRDRDPLVCFSVERVAAWSDIVELPTTGCDDTPVYRAGLRRFLPAVGNLASCGIALGSRATLAAGFLSLYSLCTRGACCSGIAALDFGLGYPARHRDSQDAKDDRVAKVVHSRFPFW